MRLRSQIAVAIHLFVLTLLSFLCAGADANAQTRVSIGVTETIETANPYGDSVSLLYGIWSEITGPFCTYNYQKGDFEGRLAERWKVENPTTWVFYLNKNYKFNDGSPGDCRRCGSFHDEPSHQRSSIKAESLGRRSDHQSRSGG